MIQAKISELKNRLSHYLKLVQEGEEIEVLDRDRPVARIIGISPAERATASSRLEQMARDGLVRRGSSQVLPLLLKRPPGRGARVLDAVLEEREGR